MFQVSSTQSISEELDEMRARVGRLTPEEMPAFLARVRILTGMAREINKVVALRKMLELSKSNAGGDEWR